MVRRMPRQHLKLPGDAEIPRIELHDLGNALAVFDLLKGMTHARKLQELVYMFPEIRFDVIPLAPRPVRW